MNTDLEKRITEIENRNKKVEADKAWETSIARRAAIVIATYVVIIIFLFAIDNDMPFINAIVPCLGFTLSTLSLGWLKQRWIERRLASR